MDRALREFRIRGVTTNIEFVINLLKHPTFLNNQYTTKFIDTTPELFDFKRRRDRGTKVLTYIADITVNGHPEVQGRAMPHPDLKPARAPKAPLVPPPPGTKTLLDEKGPQAVADWMVAQKQVLITDTTITVGHADAVDRHDTGRAKLCASVAATVQRRMLGRRHL
jgi:pyruvate carboxylase